MKRNLMFVINIVAVKFDYFNYFNKYLCLFYNVLLD